MSSDQEEHEIPGPEPPKAGKETSHDGEGTRSSGNRRP